MTTRTPQQPGQCLDIWNETAVSFSSLLTALQVRPSSIARSSAQVGSIANTRTRTHVRTCCLSACAYTQRQDRAIKLQYLFVEYLVMIDCRVKSVMHGVKKQHGQLSSPCTR